jgi:uncharacterized protein YhaN
MRIARLLLKAYGPFDGAVLDFERPAAGLQVVYGPNERGKSTAMRAIAALLYGFPTRTDDAHGRDYGALRVGAVLDDGATRLALMRRKGARQTLFEFDEGTGEERPERLVDQAAIDALLGGVGADRFLAMHGLDAARLRAGGAALATAGSDLGTLLFEASSGLSRLREIGESLQKEADALFVPRGQKPVLNATLSELEQRQKDERAAGVRPRDWAARRDALARAEEEVARLDASLRGVRGRLSHLERVRDLAPQVTRLSGLAGRLAALAGVPLLPGDAVERVAAWGGALQESEAAIAEADATLARCAAELAATAVSQPHLDAAGDIARLAGRLDAHAAARTAAPALQADADAALATLRRALRAAGGADAAEVDDPASVAAAASARVPERGPLAEARARLDARREIDTRSAAAAAALADATRAHDEARAALDAEGVHADAALLAAAVEAASAAGDLETRTAALRARRDAADAALERQADALGGPDAATLARRRALAAAEVEREAGAERARETAAATLRSDRAKVAVDLARVREERDALLAQRTVPDRAALDAARDARDTLLRDALGGTDTSALPRLAPAIDAADRIADARFDDASRLAQIESLSRRIDAMSVALGAADAEAGRLDADARAARDAWAARLATHGAPPLDAAGYRDWSAGHARLVEALAQRDALDAELRAAELDAARHLGQLSDAYAAAGRPWSGATTLAAALADARRALEADRQAASRRTRLVEDRARCARTLEQRRAALAALDAERAAADADWTHAVAGLGLPPDAPAAALAERLDALEALRDALAAWVSADRQRRLGAATIAQFRADTAALARRLGMDAPAPDDEPAFVDRVREALGAAERARDATLRLGTQREALETSRARELRRRDEARAGLDALRARAGVEGLPALHEAAARSAQRRALQQQAEEVEATLRETTGAAHDALVSEAEAADVGALQAEIEQLRQGVEAEEAARTAALAERERARAELDAVAGDGAATRAAEAVRERLAAAGRVATDWARLRLARDLLEQAVQRHAQRAQGPMLAAAARWFARLTGGRWRDLRPDWEGDSQVLAAERDDGVRLHVHQLSEGAADALFLALRMAAIEVRLASAPPVPLLLDDVLASFDDTRAALALDALAELGQRNQVVYFTHHAHLVELARRTVPAGRVAVRELEHRVPAA